MEEAHQADAAAIANPRKERDQAEAAAEKASEEVAKIQPGQDTEVYQRAKRLFPEAKIDEALKTLQQNREKRHDCGLTSYW